LRDDDIVNGLVTLAEARETDFHDHAAVTRLIQLCDRRWKFELTRKMRLCGGLEWRRRGGLKTWHVGGALSR
jgi:hypothetical protein